MGEFVVVGSMAFASYDLTREPNDFDLICSSRDFKDLLKKRADKIKWVKPTKSGMAAKVGDEIWEAEFTDRENTSSQAVFDYVKKNVASKEKGITHPIPLDGDEFYYANLDTLYMLKMSHRYLKNSPHFRKTMLDIRKMRELGAKIEGQELQNLYAHRQNSTYTYSHPKLNQGKMDFFSDDGLEYVYDHDSLHEAVRHLDRPAYTYYMEEGAEVNCSKEKFFEVDNTVRLYGVLEEACVLALERAVIPHDTPPDQAFSIALMKVCTSITSGWFREFAWENFDAIVNMAKWEDRAGNHYVKQFQRGLEDGTVIRLEN